MIKLKRAYENPSPKDGLRVLVERLWPRGLAKERAAVDLWLKDVARSRSDLQAESAAAAVRMRRLQPSGQCGAWSC